LQKIVEYLEEASLKGEKIKGVSIDRNQTILAGAIVLLEAMRSFESPNAMVCSAALREGVIVDRFLQTGWLKAGLEHHRDPRSNSVHALLEKYHGDFEHSEQVARLAKEIFLQSKGLLHDYSEEVGHLLWSAAMLHDVGMFIGRNGHHKHSYYLIRHGGLLGHSEEEVAMIASIARYHRASTPKDSHEAYFTIALEDRRLICDLAAILRIAEALDRSHRQVVQMLSILIESNQHNGQYVPNMTLELFVKPGASCEAEIWALDEKKKFFQDQFKVNLKAKLQTAAKVSE
jgi:exopolyphosphatase/guanosine-5'-triphosphate,3'-diphosphate pyrophosphatase